MPLVTEGKNAIADAIIGGTSFNKFSAANAHIIVGSNSGANAEAVGNVVGTFTTGGMTGTNVKSATPTRNNNAVSFVASFANVDAVGAWEEWGLTNAASAGQLLNRKVESLGTKTGSQTWQFTVTLTFGA
jgi:hypothetical protein